MIKMADIFKDKRRLFIVTGVIAFIILGFVLLTNPMSNTSLQTRYFTIKIPTDWKIKTDTPGSITEKNTIFKIISKTKIISNNELPLFEKDNVPIGGIQIISYEPDQPLFLPNHSEVKSEKEIKGLITKAVLINLDMTPPAASGDTSIKNENHLYLIFEDDRVAYDIYADTKYADESMLIRIAKSFKPTPKKNKFFITGNIVEITSVPGEEWRTGITLTVEKLERKWLITEITIASHQAIDFLFSNKRELEELAYV
ncbi:bla regulator protein blaR1 [Caldanaerobius fijiensis DSM 17918]|uniref:Bla regulator protein blaR1 n=2 Tax=Caldanaerobius TaxID=862261 RepID=A0A1M5FIL5_9THEO|nr:bla regulator protein blaR1 [Caldanaerobius fijiensis DSM 17918]